MACTTAHRDKDDFVPAYLQLLSSDALADRVSAAFRHLEDCDLCPRYCRINRRRSVKGAVCRTGERAVVHSYGAHHGEEDPLRGWKGSGTIFFSWCNLRCVYCQNWEISQKGIGEEVTAERLAAIMIELQAQGCHNINLVSPSHVVAQIVAAVDIAARRGLRLPLVYNTGGYDSLEALQLLDGVVDIYMPDMKYGDSQIARKYSKVRDYVAFNRAAVTEMHRQVGELVLDARGVARRGLLVRHLLLPNRLSDSEKVLSFIANKLSTHTYVNLMDQYYPCYRAGDYALLRRPLDKAEYQAALRLAEHYGLHRLDRRQPV